MKSPLANKLTLKHETWADREHRHTLAAIGRVRQAFDVVAWDRMHRQAEAATIWGSRRRSTPLKFTVSGEAVPPEWVEAFLACEVPSAEGDR